MIDDENDAYTTSHTTSHPLAGGSNSNLCSDSASLPRLKNISRRYARGEINVINQPGNVIRD